MLHPLPLFWALAGTLSQPPAVSAPARLVLDAQRRLPRETGPVRLLVEMPGAAERLRQAGFSARFLSESVAAVSVPPDAAGRLLELPGLLSLDAPRRLRPHLDVSLPLCGVPVLHKQLGVTGKGVLVALIDTGIDFRHADFRRDDGHTRIRWLLDARRPRHGSHPEIKDDYGGMALYGAADLDAVLDAEARGQDPPLHIDEADTSGHGTHIAGIAAGNGRATGKGLPARRYVGVAPEADLCVVQASRTAANEFTDEDVIAGVRFCRDRAADAGQPVVFNLSLGGLGGPHDGTTPLERALDELAGDPGRALIVSAGNSGAEDVHAGGALRGPRSETPAERELRLDLQTDRAPPGDVSRAVLDLYFDPDAQVSLALVSPKGVVHGPVEPGASLMDMAGTDEGDIQITNGGAEAPGTRRSAGISIRGGGGKPPAAGQWRLRLRGNAARYDVWVADGSADVRVRLLGSLDVDTHLELPATARRAISVGSYVSRLEWPRVDGNKSTSAEGELFFASYFSAAGPTADGRFAPDLAAPGEFLLSSLSTAAPPTAAGSVFHVGSDANYLWADDGVHAALRGTSQAAPHVAGAAALLFQMEPKLDPERLRELLRASAHGLSRFSPRLGFGKLDVALAARALRGERGARADPERSLVGVSRDLIAPGSGRALVTVVPKDRDGLPLGAGVPVEIEGSGGAWAWDGPVRDLGTGRYQRTLLAQGAPPNTAVRVSARAAGMELGEQPLITIAPERTDIGAPYRIGGGCDAAGRTLRGGFGLPGLLVFSLLLARWRKRAEKSRAGAQGI